MKFINKAFDKISGFRYTPQLLLLLVLAFGYWNVIFLSHPLKYDIIDCTYPWKYFVSECLQNHTLPMWNPYQTLGYPIHADPQVGVWYPLTWIVGYFHGYDIYSLSLEFVLHIYIAALGMYMLGRTFGFSRNVSFFMASSYMLSGFFIGNSQHYTIIVSGTWIPYIINYYLRFSREKKYIHSVTAAFFMYLLLSGGYPAYAIILGYFLTILFLYFLIGHITKKDWQALTKFIKLNIAFVFALILFSAVIITSAYTVSAYITRGEKLPLYLAQLCPFSPQSLVSIILPFASIKDLDFFNTDLSMTNIYFGLITLVFCILSFYYKKPRIIIVFLLWGVFCLTAAMGSYLPVRKFLFNYIPFMGMFRFPSIFRLFTIISFILAAGYAFYTFFENTKTQLKNIKIIVVFMMILFVIFIIWSRAQGYLTLGDFIRRDLFTVSESSRIWQHIAFQSCLQIFFLLLFLVVLWKVKDKITLRNIILLLLLTDLVVASQLNEPYTTFDRAFSTEKVDEISRTFPKNFPIPSMQNVIVNSDTGKGIVPFWRNMNIFYKQFGWDGFTSFKLSNYEFLNDSLPSLLRSTLANPPVFLSSKVFSEDSIKKHNAENKFNHKNIYLSSKEFIVANSKGLSNNKGDTAYITSFSPVDIKIHIRSQGAQMLTVLQNYYPGWEVKINNEKSDIFLANKSFICVKVPKGESNIIFSYYNSNVGFAAVITALSLFLFFIIITVRGKSKLSQQNNN